MNNLCGEIILKLIFLKEKKDCSTEKGEEDSAVGFSACG